MVPGNFDPLSNRRNGLLVLLQYAEQEALELSEPKLASRIRETYRNSNAFIHSWENSDLSTAVTKLQS